MCNINILLVGTKHLDKFWALVKKGLFCRQAMLVKIAYSARILLGTRNIFRGRFYVILLTSKYVMWSHVHIISVTDFPLLCRQNAYLKNRLLCSKFCRQNLSKPTPEPTPPPPPTGLRKLVWIRTGVCSLTCTCMQLISVFHGEIIFLPMFFFGA